MRPIKFRAWEKSLSLMWENVQDAYDTLGEHGNEGQTLTPCSFGDILEREDFVVMQFTGLLDKNGKEVYEGDIIKQNFENELGSFFEGTGEVCWCDAHMGFEVRTKNYNPETGANALGTNSEVIGNRYENPELI